MKLVIYPLLTALFFFSSCETGPDSYEKSIAETASQAAALAAGNREFALGRFIEGRWKGNCHHDRTSTQELVFENGRAWFISHYESLEGGSSFEHGLYEVVNERQINFHRMSIDSVEITKTGENSFFVPETGSTMIYYGCTFTR